MYLVCQLRSKGYPYGNLYTWLLADTSVLVLIVNSRQYKKYKLTSIVAQIDWKISQVEAVQFCCRTEPCKNKVNYFNCLSHDKNNQSKKPSSLSMLVLIVLAYYYSTDLCMYWQLYMRAWKTGHFFRKWNYALDTILHPPTPISFTHPPAR